MKNSLLLAVSALFALSASGCSLLVEGTLSSRDGGTPMDAPTSGCGIAADGERCTVEGLLGNRICLGGSCVAAECGDGFVETRDLDGMPQEDCDDENETDGDGCDTDCSFSCTEDADCGDMLVCNGDEVCNTTSHRCEPGTDVADGTACMVDGMSAMCRDGLCRAGVCPNGTPEAGEDCDDGNATDDDGCDGDCTFSCAADTDCQNGDACDGSEVCDIASHTCGLGTALACDDMDACTVDTCDGMAGCVFTSVFVDADMDGFFGVTSGAPASCVADDCNDANPAAYPGAPEPCPATVDLNCDGSTSTPTYYADCDGDGYALAGAATMTSCTAPITRPSGCASGVTGAWTSRRPVTGSIDCADTDSRARPGATTYYSTPVTTRGGYDFNCDGASSLQYPVGMPRDFVECGTSRCTGTSYIIPALLRTPTCGAQIVPYPELSHCELRFSCSRVRDNLTAIACR